MFRSDLLGLAQLHGVWLNGSDVLLIWFENQKWAAYGLLCAFLEEGGDSEGAMIGGAAEDNAEFGHLIFHA